MATNGSGSSGITAAQLHELMSSMRQGIKDEMISMKREMSAEREAADDKLLKQIKLDKAPVFRKKGNERRYRHNEEVKLKLTEARSALDETPPAVEKAKTAIEEGEKLISDRQKHIRIADRSENGWVTVEEYVDDELADNSDDEKRLLRADARASRKLKSAQKARFVTKKPVFKRMPNLQAGVHPQASLPYGQGPQMFQHVVPISQPAPSYRYQYAGRSSVAGFGPCFECGMVGHLRKYCPMLMFSKPAAAANK